MDTSKIIGQSSAMQQVFKTMEKVAATDANVLILGENGTGKELIARSLHEYSHRSHESFVAVDMGALSSNVFESELFGHVKGAFTGAYLDRTGRFELAKGGTLFLDEIGNLSAPQQAKLLRVLQERIIHKVGQSSDISIDIRLICATNMPLIQQVSQGRFRQDLLYRINTVEIHLPPLRARQGDIRLLTDHFLDLYASLYSKPKPSLSTSAWKRLETHPWPGNIRELQHSMERLVVMAQTKTIEASEIHFSNHGVTEPGFYLDTYKLDEVERLVIQKVLQRQGGNLSRAARELGISRAALYRRIEKYDLE